jgi:hypothetical protein
MPISDLSFSLNDPAAGPPTRSPYFRGKPKRRRLQDDLPLPHLPSLSSSAFNPAGPPPLPPSKNLNIRSAAANATAAEALKQILEEGGEVPVPETIGAPRDNTLGGHHFENLFADQFGVSRRRLRDLSHMSCSGDEGEERAKRRGDAHILIGERATPPPAPSPALPPQPVAPQAEEVLYSTSFEEVPESNANVDANSNSKAEVHYARHTTLFVSDAGCDIPMPRAGDPLPPVRLEADLPPMAVEHPTRVWNTLLHALATELQPLIRWEYDALDLDRNGEEAITWIPKLITGSMGWIAHLSLILPPTHSDIAGHPLAHVLPKNRYSAEYVTAVEALGGAKTWTGHYRKLKVSLHYRQPN